MSSTSITEYKPLLEVVDTSWNKYYTEMTREKFEEFLQSSYDHIYFSINKRWVRKPYIVSYGEADPEDVMVVWEQRELSRSQKACIEASKKIWIDFWKWTKPITKQETTFWHKLALKNEVAHLGR